MNEDQLRREMNAIAVPEGSRMRVAEAMARTPNSGRRWRVPAGAALATAAAFAFTAPGQAAVDWVAEAVHLKAPAGGFFKPDDRQTVATGTSPAGDAYSVEAIANDNGDVCLILDAPVAGPPSIMFGPTCTSEQRADGAYGGTTYLQLRSGGHAAFGLADPAATSATVTADDFEAIEVDLVDVSGEVERTDGTLVPIPTLSVFVAFLPPGLGDVETGSTATITAVDAGGEAVLSEDLQWVRLGPTGLTVDCGGEIAVAVHQATCADARTGELGRVEESLARPLPEALAGRLQAAGYSYVPATDGDRSIAGEPAFDLPARSPLALSAYVGAGYDSYLGRISGGGETGRLVYVLPEFPVGDLPDEGADIGIPVNDAGRTDTGGFLVDAIEGQTLAELGR